jgi:hypothetical protein
VRLAKLFKAFSKFENEGRLSPASAQLIQLSIAIAFLGHILACVWFMVGIAAYDSQLLHGVEPSQTLAWVSSSLNITKLLPEEQYAASLYWVRNLCSASALSSDLLTSASSSAS